MKTGEFSIARTRCRKRNVLCFQFTVVFPSWTSPVRPRSLPTFLGTLRILALRSRKFVCSICALFASWTEHSAKTGVFSIARTRCGKRNCLCFQFTVVFPSWTSPVRPRSPAPTNQSLSAIRVAVYRLLMEPGCSTFRTTHSFQGTCVGECQPLTLAFKGATRNIGRSGYSITTLVPIYNRIAP
jgi:hypothetical protein